MSDDLEARCHHAITHDGETYIKLADASVTFSLYRKDIATQAARIAELEAALEKIEYLDRPQVRGLPRRVTIQQIALDALER